MTKKHPASLSEFVRVCRDPDPEKSQSQGTWQNQTKTDKSKQSGQKKTQNKKHKQNGKTKQSKKTESIKFVGVCQSLPGPGEITTHLAKSQKMQGDRKTTKNEQNFMV